MLAVSPCSYQLESIIARRNPGSTLSTRLSCGKPSAWDVRDRGVGRRRMPPRAIRANVDRSVERGFLRPRRQPYLINRPIRGNATKTGHDNRQADQPTRGTELRVS